MALSSDAAHPLRDCFSRISAWFRQIIGLSAWTVVLKMNQAMAGSGARAAMTTSFVPYFSGEFSPTLRSSRDRRLLFHSNTPEFESAMPTTRWFARATCWIRGVVGGSHVSFAVTAIEINSRNALYVGSASPNTDALAVVVRADSNKSSSSCTGDIGAANSFPFCSPSPADPRMSPPPLLPPPDLLLLLLHPLSPTPSFFVSETELSSYEYLDIPNMEGLRKKQKTQSKASKRLLLIGS